VRPAQIAATVKRFGSSCVSDSIRGGRGSAPAFADAFAGFEAKA